MESPDDKSPSSVVLIGRAPIGTITALLDNPAFWPVINQEAWKTEILQDSIIIAASIKAMIKIGAYIFIIIIFLLILSNYNFSVCDNNCEDILKQAAMKTTELIALNDYPAEEHTVETNDGYKLVVHRIPYGKKVSKRGGIPVLLMHGLMSNSGTFIDNADQSLGFILADEGYDVWMGNVRGNEGSEHAIYARDEPEYWDYTFHDTAEIDLPTIIDYVQNVTKYKKILYVGYSMATTMGFVLFSQPEYNDKVAGFVALAPITSLHYLTEFILYNLITHFAKLQPLLKMIGIHTFQSCPIWFRKYIPTLCHRTSICKFLGAFTVGYSNYLSNTSRLPIYIPHRTEVTSIKLFTSLKQSDHAGPSTKFDYGRRENINRYGTATPPLYNPSKIVIPIAMFSSANDAVSTPFNVEIINRQLKSVIAHELISEPMFNHDNFYASISMRSLLADKMLHHLRYMWDRYGLN